MKQKLIIYYFLLVFLSSKLIAQNPMVFDGQFSTVLSVNPDNRLGGFVGARYIPELSYQIDIDSFSFIDFELSTNFSGSTLFHPFDSTNTSSKISPYRLWARYSGKQFELRMGLQKIDFGSASLLRPIQWFNQIDPRDPLQLTNGVYGLLGRYYFLNNANIWLWVLYGNEKTRGFDLIETNKSSSEFGGRFQFPVPKGELTLSYHHRNANSLDQVITPQYESIPENRIGIDGKWDIGPGVWFELTYSHKSKDLSSFTNQALLNIGADYTFAIGNGLNMTAEHLMINYSKAFLTPKDIKHITAATVSYPLSLYDQLSSVFYYNWPTKDFTFFINYQHQFSNFVAYIMAFYNPTNQEGIQTNELLNNFSGPGIRLMFVYNH